MKKLKLLLPASIMFLFLGCGGEQDRSLSTDVITNPNTAQEGVQSAVPVIDFEKDLHDFGKLVAGEKAVYSFKFKNTGNADLVISQVNSSCGCTVPNFPKEAVKPGEGGVIKVTFDSASRKGMQNKTVTVVSNCQPNKTVIRIKAQVISP